MKVFDGLSDPKTVAQQALVGEIASLDGRPVLLMLSGGSALELLDGFDVSVLGPQVAITVLDERFSADPSVNNWKQIEASGFYEKAKNVGCEMIVTIPVVGEKLEEFADRWEKDLRRWVQRHPHRRVLATVGIGGDGHVAGLSPFPENPEKFTEFVFTGDWVVGYGGNLEPRERVSVTAEFMEKKIDTAFVYVVGEEKRQAWEKVIANDGRMAETPARILREMDDVRVFTDL